MSGSIVFVGDWYLQSSLMDLNTQMMEQHYHSQQQTKQIEELNKQVIKQNDQISQQQSQLRQLNIIIDVLLNNNAKVSREKQNVRSNYNNIIIISSIKVIMGQLITSLTIEY